MRIWDVIEEKFGRSSKKIAVIKTLMMYGFRIDGNGIIYCGKVKIPYVSVARACNVDRRTVKETIKDLLKNNILKEFFMNLEPAGAFLRKVAKILGYRCLVIRAVEDKPGILAMVSTALAKRNVNIVQVIAEDPNLFENPRLYIITSNEIPGEAISEILQNKDMIESLTIF